MRFIKFIIFILLPCAIIAQDKVTVRLPLPPENVGLNGIGQAGRVVFWTGTKSLSSSGNLYWDDAQSFLGIFNSTPTSPLDIRFSNNTAGYNAFKLQNTNSGTTAQSKFSILNDNSTGSIELGTFSSGHSTPAWRRAGLLSSQQEQIIMTSGNTLSGGVGRLGFYLGGYDGNAFLAQFSKDGYIFQSSTLSATGAWATHTASAVVEINSTTKGFLPPRMTTAQRNAISSPATGLTLYCTDCTATDASTGVLQTYNGTTWKNHW